MTGGPRSAVTVVSVLAMLGLALAGCRRADESAPPVREPSAPAEPRPAEPAGPPHPDVAATIEQVLGSAHHPWLRWPEIPDVAPTLQTLYGGEPDGLWWFAGDKPHPALGEALEELAGAADHGLDPSDYDASRLAAEWTALRSGTPSPAERALLDLGVSVGVLRLLSAIHVGRVDPATLAWGYHVAPKELSLVATLDDIHHGKPVRAAIAELEPPFPHYARGRRALARYRALARAGEPPAVPPLPAGRRKVEPGEPWEGVGELTARLRALGDLETPGPAAGARGDDGLPTYEGPLVEGVRLFQKRHGLEDDGVVGRGTLRALDVSVAHRVRQIELALERMRWLPEISHRPSVFVNVPLFRLWATDPRTGEEPLRMNVVVGQALDHRTPLLVEEMRYVVFRPFWNVPYSIAVREIVPQARKDPSSLERQSFEIVASGDEDATALPPTPENLDRVVAGVLHVRQRPGPHNSMGLAKFIFPNAENVYMHGTPATQLFSRRRRDFSRGCIRLEDPARFAEWVLRDRPEWTRERIEAAMRGDRPTRVDLGEPLMVVLFYSTVHVNSEDVVFFVDDIYGHDATLDQALRRGYPYPRAAGRTP